MKDYFESTTQSDKTFNYLIKLMGYRDQLRINHWQTLSYAEHKLTDDMLGIIDGFVDKLGETVLGTFGRPKINTISNNISDYAIASTEYILKSMDEETQQLLDLYTDCNQEGILNIITDWQGSIKKFIYLSTLK